MKKKILLVSILATFMLVAISFAAAVNTNNSADKKESPLYRLRTRRAIEEKISKKPIKAIIYSHSHYALGAGAMVDDPKSVAVIGHKKLNETVKTNLEGGGAPTDTKARRAVNMKIGTVFSVLFFISKPPH